MDRPYRKFAPKRTEVPVRQPFKAQKSLGQHWLVDQTVIAGIVAATGAAPGVTVLEIGPGQGVLTDALAATGANVLAVDLDRRAVRHLIERYADNPAVHIAHGDILALTPEKFAELFPQVSPETPLTLVGNLPYQITNRIFRHFIGDLGSPAQHPWRNRITHLTVMVQQEVAQRLTASPGSKAYSLLTLATQRLATVEAVIPRIAPTAFKPPPKVTSAVVRLTPRPAPLLPHVPAATLQQVAQVAFSQRRKTLRNSLAALIPPPLVAQAFAATEAQCGLPTDSLAGRRPETLSLDEFGALTLALIATGAPLKMPSTLATESDE